jgi:opacity protein-like surface antigen
MKKMRLFLVAIAAVTGMSASAQVVEEGNILVDAYYGFPNLYTAVFKRTYVDGGGEMNVKANGLGPVGIRGEYLLTDKFGLGLDIGFNNTSVTFQDEETYYNENTGQNETRIYDYEFSTQKLGVMVTFNYHFIENDKVDFYGMLGAGYGNRSYRFESTDPNYSEGTIKGVIPVASRLGIGVRYFFSDNIGANVGLGFGQGGLINAGLSFKL